MSIATTSLDLIQRDVAHGNTKHAADAIIAAAEAWQAADRAYQSAIKEADDRFHPGYVGFYLDPKHAGLMDAMSSIHWHGIQREHKHAEVYPLSQWAKATRSIVRATKRIREEIAKLEALAVPA